MLQTAWHRIDGGYLRMAAFTPSSMTFAGTRHGKALYRLSIAGFKTRDAAQSVCTRIRSSGGKCFVRAAQGDRLAAWFKQGGTAIAVRGPAPLPFKGGSQQVEIPLDGVPLKRVVHTMPKHAPVVIASR